MFGVSFLLRSPGFGLLLLACKPFIQVLNQAFIPVNMLALILDFCPH